MKPARLWLPSQALKSGGPDPGLVTRTSLRVLRAAVVLDRHAARCQLQLGDSAVGRPDVEPAQHARRGTGKRFECQLSIPKVVEVFSCRSRSPPFAGICGGSCMFCLTYSPTLRKSSPTSTMRFCLPVLACLALAASPPVSGLGQIPAPPPAGQEMLAAGAPAETPASLLSLSDEELRRRIETDPAALGSLSIGTPGGGVLLNAVALEPGPLWTIAPGAATWGTSETMAAIQVAVETVHELFPDTPPIFIGDISDEDGGRLKRHETHQAGRDVDFGFYYKPGKGTWYTPATAANLDLARNWALVRALIVRTDVETILLDTRIQRLLYKHALSLGEDKAWLDRVFQFVKGSRDAIVRHVARHRTHYHVRFYNPVAQELGRRAHPMLVEMQVMKPPVYSVPHLVRAGQTLGQLAARYGTTVRAIMQANSLRTTQIRAGHTYRIPVRTAAPPPDPVVVPRRLLPPQTPPALAAVEWPTAETLYGMVSER